MMKNSIQLPHQLNQHLRYLNQKLNEKGYEIRKRQAWFIEPIRKKVRLHPKPA